MHMVVCVVLGQANISGFNRAICPPAMLTGSPNDELMDELSAEDKTTCFPPVLSCGAGVQWGGSS